jgi:hypothetical protein
MAFYLTSSGIHTLKQNNMPSIIFSDKYVASNPGTFILSDDKFRLQFPELYHIKGGILGRLLGNKTYQYNDLKAIKLYAADARQYAAGAIQKGDTRAAGVISLSPLRIAAYNDDLDCVVMLQFPQEFALIFDLKIGTQLLTVNTFGFEEKVQGDLITGPLNSNVFQVVSPIIADFLVEDTALLADKKNDIDDEEWAKMFNMGRRMHRFFPSLHRDGRPGFSGKNIFEIRTIPDSFYQ